jgi:hypothetical protein
MRDKLYLVGFLLAPGMLLYLGRGLLAKSALVTWGLTFAGTTAVAVLGMALYISSQRRRVGKWASMTFSVSGSRHRGPSA